MSWVLLHLLLFGAAFAPLPTPYASSEGLSIEGFQAPASVSQFGIETVVVDAHGKFSNPFDPADVALDAEIHAPSGAIYSLPGFFTKEFGSLNYHAAEQVGSPGLTGWRLRICPTEAGPYTVHVTFKDETGSASKDFSFVSVKSQGHGFVGVSKEDRRYFAFGDGSSYFPIGANVAWVDPGGAGDYDTWLPKYQAQGCNYMRVWLAPSFVTFGLEQPGIPQKGQGMGQFDLANAWKLDRVLDESTERGIYVQLCLDSYNELRDRDAFPFWEHTPQNEDNGGPLRVISDFWTSSAMDRLYKAKLRYLVARYAAYTHVFAWEMWNEVDLVRGYNPDVVRDWHQEMGTELMALDPYDHMITTSFSDSAGQRNTDLIKELDFAQTHFYGPNLIGGIANQVTRKTAWGKPNFVAEVGADSSGDRAKDDPLGIQVHDPLWISMATGAAGGAIPWWWDSLIDPNNLYPLFGAFSRFCHGIDFAHEGFRAADLKLSYQNPNQKAPAGDLVLQSGTVSWNEDESNQPTAIFIKDGRLVGPMPAGLLHGVRNHRDLHNPLTVNITSPEPTSLHLTVMEVSTWGGASLRVSLDGRVVVNKVFDTGENNSRPQAGHQFDGVLEIPIPAGTHKLVVEDVGNDWIRVGYRFKGIVPKSTPPLTAWVLGGNDTAIGWVCQAGRNWRDMVVKEIPPAVPPTVLEMAGLARGVWKAELWDTWTGRVMETETVRVGLDGSARVRLPLIGSDIALKMLREP
jgi:hypothetical protein